MIDDTLRLIWTDTLITLMLGVILICQLLTGDRYWNKLNEGWQLAEQWKTKRQVLAASARRLTRRVSFWIFYVGVAVLTVGTIFAKQLKALNPPKYPILVSEIAMGILVLSCVAFYVAMINSEER